MGSRSDRPQENAEGCTASSSAAAPDWLCVCTHSRQRFTSGWGIATVACLKVIIAAAGKARSPGRSCCANLPLPLSLAKTCYSAMGSLLSMVRMPSGVPVARCHRGAKNTSLYATQIAWHIPSEYREDRPSSKSRDG